MAVQISGNDITVPRDGTFSRNVSIAGTLTYEDVTNVDSIGLVTARNGIEVGASPGVGASISVDGNAIFSGITTATTLRAPTGIVTSLITNTARATTGIVTTLTATTGIVTTLTTNTLTANSTTKVGSGVTLSPDGDVFATGVCTATSFSGSGANLTGIVAIPSGGIILWSGAADAIPSGFVLCDGNNSTPDLRNRFVVGAGDSYAVDATGGATTDSISLSISGTTGGMVPQGYTSSGNGAVHNATTSHVHSFSGSGSATVDTLPPYYALCYIMKT